MATRTKTTATTITEYVRCGVSDQAGAAGNGCAFSFQPSLFDYDSVSLEEVFEAYYLCRKNKRNSAQALEFETDLEANLIRLRDEINNGTYKIGPSTVFVIDKPVKREIFAAGFRDRIVHHLLINKINGCLEKNLIYDCYACRAGKGTHFGIGRLDHFIRSASNNYTKTAWILKLDIKGFFMSIDKRILWKELRKYLIEHYNSFDLPLVLRLCEQIIFNDPRKGCIRKSPLSKWDGLPDGKSLFNAGKHCGIPIGNLTSQVFANFYMSFLDHYVKHDLKIRYYGRYVDDFFLIHNDKAYLVDCLEKIRAFLVSKLRLRLNDKKTVLQPVTFATSFLGVTIVPGHICISKRTSGNFRTKINDFNRLNEERRLNHLQMHAFRDSVNSYLGIMSHYNTYRLRKSILDELDKRLLLRINIQNDFGKISLRRQKDEKNKPEVF